MGLKHLIKKHTIKEVKEGKTYYKLDLHKKLQYSVSNENEEHAIDLLTAALKGNKKALELLKNKK